ncbi:MAG: hypothetical protein H6577_05815 [Lewinellaceae bacterium]|nr:hypothetical protein [Saprospiraceae bacterium]MCB9337623.1 hypothetical protein [Lewinellaceae bacterium]
MNHQLKSSLLLLTTAFLCVFSSCQKDPAPASPADEATVAKAKESLASQQLILSSFHIAQRGAEDANGLIADGGVEERTDTCGNVTVVPPDPFVFPKLVTVDFGSGCTDADGKFKVGKVIMNVGAIWEPNAQISVAYDNYAEDGINVEGQFVFTNLSTATAAILSIDAQQIKLTDPNGYSFAFSGNQTYTQTAGNPTWWDWHDDVYQVAGHINTVLSNGETVNWLIQSPLEKANICNYISKGTGVLDVNGLPVLVDYGNGTCDNQGTFTINGQVYPFSM